MLNHLSPREFEEYCQALLMCHYNCKVELTGQSGDEGRDLIIHHSNGVIVAECKHYVASTVGRPIVQKLHSAILTMSATRGMIITTGRFSAEAEEYSRKLTDVSIELIDAAKLAHVISVTYTNAPISSKLAGGIRTTPDAEFPIVFAKSVFSDERYSSGKDFKTPVHVARTTRYRTYYVAEFDASGSVDTAAGRRSARWGGFVWVRGDGEREGFGSPRPYCEELPPPIPLSRVLQEVPGKTESPELQPHQAVAAMKEYVLRNCGKRVSYSGRNNVSYSKTITPSRNDITISALVLYYIPYQTFVITIGGARHEGAVDEQQSPAKYLVNCQSLSTCTVCGTATTEDNQVLCAVCFRPAHRWSLLFPDSIECKKCGAYVCRHHAVRRGGRCYCLNCGQGGRELRPRWLPCLVFSIIVTIVGAVIGLFMAKEYIFWTTLLAVAAWAPLIFMLMQSVILRKAYSLTYSKESGRP